MRGVSVPRACLCEACRVFVRPAMAGMGCGSDSARLHLSPRLLRLTGLTACCRTGRRRAVPADINWFMMDAVVRKDLMEAKGRRKILRSPGGGAVALMTPGFACRPATSSSLSFDPVVCSSCDVTQPSQLSHLRRRISLIESSRVCCRAPYTSRLMLPGRV